MQIAEGIKRVGKRYFVQTSNLYFPIELHFVFPLFQFLPIWLRVWLVTHFNLDWYAKIPDRDRALQEVSSIRLLTKKKLQKLFPQAHIFEEKYFGLTKSFIVYKGWNNIS